MNPVLKVLTQVGFMWAVGAMKSNQELKNMVRKLGISISLWLLAFALGWFGILFVLAAIFFALADIDMWIIPAVVTGGVSLLAALLVLIQGATTLKRK